MDLELKDRVVWVTGASEGLGAAIASRLAQEGARLALCARRESALREVASGLTASGADVMAVPCDVTHPTDLERFVRAAQERFGRVNAIVNNAGKGAAEPFEAVDDAAWQADLDLKLYAAIRLVRAALPLLTGGGGSVVNILALAAKTPGARTLPSSVSRAAGMALTKALSKDLGPRGVRVNAVLIGIVESGQWERRAAAQGKSAAELYPTLARELSIPLGRVGRAEELADLVAFLLSARAAYISGTAINFDGGLSAAV